MKVRSPRDVAVVVREARLTQHLSQADLADRLHVSRSLMSSWSRDGARLQLGLVLKALDAVGLVMSVSFERLTRRDTSGHADIESPLDW
jgi:transcriptional regulator with XRE-family HTH domain